MRRQNPLELVFEDLSTFDAENPIVGSLLREIDIKRKQFDSDFIKSLPSHRGKEFGIRKRLDKLKDIKAIILIIIIIIIIIILVVDLFLLQVEQI